MSVSRGVIIGPRMKKLDGGGVKIESSSIHPADLRRYVLYWDMIDWPDNNIVSIGGSGSGDLALLQQEGILSRSMVRLSGWSGPTVDLFTTVQEAVFYENSKGSGADWAIAQSAPSLILPGERDTRRAVEVDLARAVLSPSEDVPMEDVLDFKRRRRDELLKFRRAIDGFYLEAVSSGDIHRARENAIGKLRASIEELDRVMSEPGWRRLAASWRMELSLTDAIKSAITNGAFTAAASLNPELVFSNPALTALGATIGISIVSLPKFRAEVPKRLSPFTYVYHSEKELRSKT